MSGSFFLFGFTIILVAPGVTILPPEITRRAVLFGVKFCLREKPLSSPLPSAGLCADPRSRVRLAFVLPYAVLSIAILGIRGTRAGPTRTRPTGQPGFNSSPYRPAYSILYLPRRGSYFRPRRVFGMRRCAVIFIATP